MKLLKKYNHIYKLIIFILILTLIMTLLNLIFTINNNINSIICLISVLLFSLILGIKKGLKTEEKAYIEGLKIGLLNILTLYILNCITLNFALPIKNILYNNNYNYYFRMYYRHKQKEL